MYDPAVGFICLLAIGALFGACHYYNKWLETKRELERLSDSLDRSSHPGGKA